MHRIRGIFLLFTPLLALLLATPFAIAPQSAPPAQPPPSTQAPASKQAASPAAQQPNSQKPEATPPVPAKHPKKHPKVYTDDDFKSGGNLAVDGEQLDFNTLNDCDRACFDRVRNSSHIYTTSDSYWRQNVLAALDTVRKDSEWQTFLTDLYALHLKFCSIASDKQAELAKVADPNNVTEREIRVDEKYDAKFRALQSSAQALYLRKETIQRKYATKSYSLSFMNIQLSRIQNAGCPSQPPPDSPDDHSDDSNDP
jgi:hypothetical protein